MSEHLTLSELSQNLKSAIEHSFQDPYWVIAEISELRVNNRSGHCYLELIEKNEKNDKIKAKIRANIWAFTFRMLKPYFETTTGRPLSDGLKVLVKVIVEYHEVYSLSLNILDIDPSYTIGELALKRQEIINKLEEEGIFDMNKEIEMPLVPQNIAIISSDTAAGYEDFMNQLENNEFGFVFNTRIFKATMQGDKAEDSIIKAMDKVYQYENQFDVLVIIRGGGSKIDLTCFDSYWLAYHVTQFPLPVLTGIGHERDETIVDLVANTKLKTPTAVAGFLINKLYQFETYLIETENQIFENVREKLHTSVEELSSLLYNAQNIIREHITFSNKNLMRRTNSLQNYTERFLIRRSINTNKKIQFLNSLFADKKYNQKQNLALLNLKTVQHVKSYFNQRINKIELYQNTMEHINPEKLLKKGYSITYHNGKLVTSKKQLKNEDVIDTILSDGKITSKVKSLINKS